VSLRIVLYAASGAPEELVMEFDEVSLDTFALGTYQDEWRLVIRSMRERGWESARYRVLDDEEDWLGFYCKTISLEVRPIKT
jgi:hypothetical protein